MGAGNPEQSLKDGQREHVVVDHCDSGGSDYRSAEQIQVREELRLTWQEINVSTVGSHISNARKHLRRVLPGAQEGKPE